MMERPSRTLKVKRVRNNMYSSERCAQANNEKKDTDIDVEYIQVTTEDNIVLDA